MENNGSRYEGELIVFLMFLWSPISVKRFLFFNSLFNFYQNLHCQFVGRLARH